MIRKKLRQWELLLRDDGFRMVGDADRKELAVLADHVPQLLGQGGQLSYKKGNDRITKKN